MNDNPLVTVFQRDPTPRSVDPPVIVAEGPRRAVRTHDRNPYGPDSPHSYFRDLVLAAEAEQRASAGLSRALEKGGIIHEGAGPPPPPAFRDSGDIREVRSRLMAAAERAPRMQKRDLSSAPGAGGEFVPASGPPVFVADAFSTAARSRSVLAEVLPTRDLPAPP
jgi:hypothetical protein